MVIIFFSVTPIIIALIIFILSLLHEVASCADIITTIGWIVVIALSIGVVGYNLFRKAPSGNKVVSSIISIVATAVSLLISRTFLFGLAGMDTTGVLETIEFGFVLIFGGIIWLICVGLCTYASVNCFLDDCEGVQYVFSILAIIGSAVLANVFGLL